MSTAKKPIPPVDVIHEDSGPPLTGVQEKPGSNAVDVDDAQLEEPKDDAFKKSAQAEDASKRPRKRAQTVQSTVR